MPPRWKMATRMSPCGSTPGGAKAMRGIQDGYLMASGATAQPPNPVASLRKFRRETERPVSIVIAIPSHQDTNPSANLKVRRPQDQAGQGRQVVAQAAGAGKVHQDRACILGQLFAGQADA